MPRCSSMYASMQIADAHMTARMRAVDPWKHQNSIMVACKQQNYGSMQAAEPW